jgi:hypothetical protein
MRAVLWQWLVNPYPGNPPPHSPKSSSYILGTTHNPTTYNTMQQQHLPLHNLFPVSSPPQIASKQSGSLTATLLQYILYYEDEDFAWTSPLPPATPDYISSFYRIESSPPSGRQATPQAIEDPCRRQQRASRFVSKQGDATCGVKRKPPPKQHDPGRPSLLPW